MGYGVLEKLTLSYKKILMMMMMILEGGEVVVWGCRYYWCVGFFQRVIFTYGNETSS